MAVYFDRWFVPLAAATGMPPRRCYLDVTNAEVRDVCHHAGLASLQLLIARAARPACSRLAAHGVTSHCVTSTAHDPLLGAFLLARIEARDAIEAAAAGHDEQLVNEALRNAIAFIDRSYALTDAIFSGERTFAS